MEWTTKLISLRNSILAWLQVSDSDRINQPVCLRLSLCPGYEQCTMQPLLCFCHQMQGGNEHELPCLLQSLLLQPLQTCHIQAYMWLRGKEHRKSITMLGLHGIRVWQRLMLTCAFQVMSRILIWLTVYWFTTRHRDARTQCLPSNCYDKYFTMNSSSMPFQMLPSLMEHPSDKPTWLLPSSLSTETLRHISFPCAPMACLSPLTQTVLIHSSHLEGKPSRPWLMFG